MSLPRRGLGPLLVRRNLTMEEVTNRIPVAGKGMTAEETGQIVNGNRQTIIRGGTTQTLTEMDHNLKTQKNGTFMRQKEEGKTLNLPQTKDRHGARRRCRGTSRSSIRT